MGRIFFEVFLQKFQVENIGVKIQQIMVKIIDELYFMLFNY